MRRGPPITVLLMALAIAGCSVASREDPVDTTLPNGTALVARNDDIMADNLEMAADNMDAMADNMAAPSAVSDLPYDAQSSAPTYGDDSPPPADGAGSAAADTPATNASDE